MWRVCKHWREFRLNKNLSRALAVVVALGAVYTGTSWWLGQRVEAQYTSLLDRVAAQLGPDKIAERRYDRGLFGAQSTVVLQFRVPDGEAPEAAEETPGADPAKPEGSDGPESVRIVRVTLQDDIRHGPLAGWRPAAARVRTQLISVEGLDDETRQLFAKASAPEVVTYVGFGGNYQGNVHLPAGELTDPKRPESRAQWQALDYDFDLSADATQFSGKLQWPQMSLQMEGAEASDGLDAPSTAPDAAAAPPATSTTRVDLKGLVLNFAYHQPTGQWLMPLGKSDGQLEAFTVTHRAGRQTEFKPTLALKALRLESETTENAGLLDAVTRAVGPGSLGATEFKEIRYESKFSRIDSQALATAQLLLMAFVSGTPDKQPVDDAAIRDMAQRWMNAKPAYSDRYSATAQDGQVGEMGYEMSLRDAPSPDSALPDGMPWFFALLQRLHVSADMRLPKTFLPAIAGMLNDPGMQPGALAEMADDFARRGWLQDDAGVWVGKVEYGQGALTLNGKPFSLQSLMTEDGDEDADDDEGDAEEAEEAEQAEEEPAGAAPHARGQQRS